MKRNIFITFILLLLLIISSCKTTDKNEVLDVTIKSTPAENTFKVEGFNTITIMPSYKYLGIGDFSDENVTRKYYIYQEVFSKKTILIYYVAMKEGDLPKDVNWIDNVHAIYHENMKAVYNYITGRALSTITDKQISLPDSYFLAQEIHLLPNKAILRMLITPDDFSSGGYKRALEELDRVAIYNNY